MFRDRNLSSTMVIFLLFFLSLCTTLTFQGCFSAAAANQLSKKNNNRSPSNGLGSSVIFAVTGNVYPKGYFHVTLNIGRPPKPYFLDIDTGSDLTWLQCDAPCTKCTPAPHSLYKPFKNLITCEDPRCDSLRWRANQPCETPDEQCDYVVEYADHGSSMGVLVKDDISLRFTNGSHARPHLAFGCGYNQEFPASVRPPYTDGVLGLGDGKSSILSQLRELGLSRNVVGHCLSSKGGGFLFLGDDLIPSSGIAWMPILQSSLQKHYSLGPADLLYGGRATGVKGISLVFDSGSTYSYFNSEAYKVLLSTVKKDLNRNQLKDAAVDKSLPVCWKGAKPFKSIEDVKIYFKPLVLIFTKAKNTRLEVPPEAYLIVTEHGNACLGVLNGTEVGLGNLNVIGDISMQDKMVIYDNEKQRIGWVSANCHRLPNTDRDYNEFSHPEVANLGNFDNHFRASYDSRQEL